VTAVELPEALHPLVAEPARSAILLDFDGTLAEIVARPELARPVDGARETLRDLALTFGVVALISGRPTEDLRALVDVEGVRYVGLYGLEADLEGRVPEAVHALARDAAQLVAGAWAEDKGGSVAVHYRQANDPDAARVAILDAIRSGVPEGWEAIEGKMVVELVPAGRARKGGAVRQLIADVAPSAVLYAGDDLADLEAFEVLGALSSHDGLHAVRITVRGPETPHELVDQADLTVDGPSGLVAVLRSVVEAAA
jgi:trehalose 6-phosphate phosphatase